MGYDVHITRKDNWFDEQGDALSLAEWLAYIEGDPEMRLDGYAEAKLKDGSVLRSNNPSMAVWVEHPQHGTRDGMAWMWLSSGNVQAKNPDEDTLRKMWRIAQSLGARVQGDEGELYESSGLMVRDAANDLPATFPKKAWWRFW